jgi:hypothetical protein
MAFEKSFLKTKQGANEMKPGDRSAGSLGGPLEMLVWGLNPDHRAGCVRADDR